MSQAPSEALAVKNPGIRLVLKYSGIPTSWLDKPPKLPSRNWLIFISVTSSIAGLYVYDRRECKKIKQHYIDRVRELSERPSSPMDLPRKVTVYGAKWPGDEEYDASIKYFRKYVKVGAICSSCYLCAINTLYFSFFLPYCLTLFFSPLV